MADGTPSPDKLDPTKRVAPSIADDKGKSPGEEVRPFKPYMEGGQRANPLLESGKTQVSPFDLAHGKVPAPGPTLNTIQEQSKMAQTTLGDINNQLQTPKLKLKQSTKYLLKNKLNSAKGHIKSASDKIGAPAVNEEKVSSGGGPLDKFIALVTDGQNQLDATQKHLTDLSKKGDQIKPADMLMIQIKLSKAQQELEYSSLLLGKAVDDLKMMMNIQL